MDDGQTNEVFDCPRGCGTLEHQSTAGAMEGGIKGAVGNVLMVASIVIFVAYIVWLFASGNGTNENLDTGQLFIAIFICVAIFGLGATIGIADSWNHHCQTCKGVLMDSKTVSEKFWGDGGTKIVPLMEMMGDSTSDLDCPGCGEKMGLIPISYTAELRKGRRRTYDQTMDTIDFLYDVAIAVNPTSEENLEIDACNDCMMLWFDGGEAEKIEGSLSMRGSDLAEEE